MATWSEFQKKYRDSVPKIIVTRSFDKVDKPYLQPDDARVRGSGFVFDTERNLVLTNCHVISNALNIVVRIQCLGKKDIRCRLISYCTEKDIAVILLSLQGCG